MFYGWFGRFLRVSIALVLTWAASYYSGQDWFIALTPVLLAASKYLRDRANIDIKVL